jgi:hypothetical protein
LAYLTKDKLVSKTGIPILILYNHKNKTFTELFNDSIPSKNQLENTISKYIK